MDIAEKIKNARKAAGLTQEQAAEAIGVSRQTISNWENAKTYPDIVSAVKMSDLYDISLDALLKEPAGSNGYLHYLAESTNTVESKKRLTALSLILCYLLIWSACILVFWLMPVEEGGVYSLCVFWFILPVTTFIIAALIGRYDAGGRAKWWFAAVFGLLYMLAGYATFSAANTAAFGKLNAPALEMIPIGAIIAAVGMGIGAAALKTAKSKQNKSI